jgi:hypothetical protein
MTKKKCSVLVDDRETKRVEFCPFWSFLVMSNIDKISSHILLVLRPFFSMTIPLCIQIMTKYSINATHLKEKFLIKYRGVLKTVLLGRVLSKRTNKFSLLIASIPFDFTKSAIDEELQMERM